MLEMLKESLVLCGFLVFGTVSGCEESSIPAWPESYMLKGAFSIPFSEIKQPFQEWRDGTKGSEKLRLDYFGGVSQTLEFSNWPNANGSFFHIEFVTSETVKNKKECQTMTGSGPGAIHTGTSLPDPSKFTCSGKEEFEGTQVEKWIRKVNIDEVTRQYTLRIRWKKNLKADSKTAIPVSYEVVAYDANLGTHYEHQVVSFYAFKPFVPIKSVFNIPSICQNPTLVDEESMIHPLKEIVHQDHRLLNRAWIEFQATHSRQFNGSEHTMREHIFKNNYRLVHAHNKANLGYKLALNHLADRTDEELKVMRGRLRTRKSFGGSPFPYGQEEVKAANVPVNFDWRIRGAVNPIKNQASCGSCWSFGTTGTLEGAFFLKTGKLIDLSEQALIDCSWGFGNNGCSGGLDYTSYEWIMKHGGIPLEEEYGSYKAENGLCHFNDVKLVAPITGWVNVTTHNEKALKIAIFKHGPISIAINAGLPTFTLYSSGVYYDPACKGDYDDLDHAVLAVGYGWLDHKKYWLVRNSWGPNWGNDGYILMEIKNNNCGVMTSPTYVTM